MKFQVFRTSGEYESIEPPSVGEDWLIEFSSLEELVEFCNSHGEVVLRENYSGKTEIPAIEIYDDYRE